MIKLLVSNVMKRQCVSQNGLGIDALLRHLEIEDDVDTFHLAHVPPAGGR